MRKAFVCFIVSFLFALIFTSSTFGQTTVGPNYPGAGSDNNTIGTISWSSPINAINDNNVPTTAILTKNTTSHYLIVKNFGFSIPAGAVITGINVEIEKNQATKID